MARLDQVPEIEGSGVVVSAESDHIGYLRRVIVDDHNREITCVTVMTGWRRRSECFIPMHDAIIQLNEIRVPYNRRMVRNAPRAASATMTMTPTHSALLAEYYGVTAEMATQIADFGVQPVSRDEKRADSSVMGPDGNPRCVQACWTTITAVYRTQGAGRSYHRAGAPAPAEYSMQKYQNRNRTPGILALAALMVVMVTVALVLVLAGGNQTKDGTGRNQLADVRAPVVATEGAGSGTGGPAR